MIENVFIKSVKKNWHTVFYL